MKNGLKNADGQLLNMTTSAKGNNYWSSLTRRVDNYLLLH